MAVDKKAMTKKKAGRPPSGKRRPVVALRVHEDMYDSIVADADRLKLTISEEVARRLDRYTEYVAAMGEVNAWLREARASRDLDFAAQLRKAGFTPIVGTDGTLWAEPGMRVAGSIHGGVLHPDVLAAIEGAVSRAIKNAKKD